jgi:hypothetical protein
MKDDHFKIYIMKKIAIVGLLVILVFMGILLHWRNVTIAKFDSDFRQSLAGTWLREEDNLPREVCAALSMRCTNTVTADGSFLELSWFNHSDRTNTYRRTGIWLVKNGNLIETIKTSSNPSEATPHTLAGRLVRANASGFTVRWPNSAETVWKKIIQ